LSDLELELEMEMELFPWVECMVQGRMAWLGLVDAFYTLGWLGVGIKGRFEIPETYTSHRICGMNRQPANKYSWCEFTVDGK